MRIAFPSAEFPALPSVTIEVPDGWAPIPVAEALVAAVRPSGDGTFAPNVVISSRRVPAPFDTAAAAAELDDTLGRLDQVEMLEPIITTVAGEPAFGRIAAFSMPEVGTVAQLHIIVALEVAGYVDVLHMVGTCGGDRVDVDLPDLRDILSGAVVER